MLRGTLDDGVPQVMYTGILLKRDKRINSMF